MRRVIFDVLFVSCLVSFFRFLIHARGLLSVGSGAVRCRYILCCRGNAKTGHTALASPLSRTNIAQVVSCVCCLKKVKRVNTLTFAVDKKNGCFFICVLYVYGLPCFRVRARRRFSICLRPTLFGVLFFGRKEEPFCFLYILSCAACGGTGGGCRWRALWFLLVFWGEVVFS